MAKPKTAPSTSPVKPTSTPTASPDEYNFQWAEAAILDGLNPEAKIDLNHVLMTVRTLAFNAHKRKLTDENFAHVINHVCDVHLMCQKLEDAVLLRDRLAKGGEATPNLDKTINGLVTALKAQREWCVEHTKLVRQCALPGTPVH